MEQTIERDIANALASIGIETFGVEIERSVSCLPDIKTHGCLHRNVVFENSTDKRPEVKRPEVKRILKHGNLMIVFWEDGTKTIVKRAEDEPDSDYAAFTAALGIKIYGSNSALKRIVAKAEKPKK